MTNREMISILNSLEAMAVREKRAIEVNPGCKRMNIKVVHKIFTNKKQLKEKLEPYEAALKELADRYEVVKFDNGLNIENLEQDKRKQFISELNELMELDIDIKIEKVHIEQFGNYDISQEDMAALEFMVI